MPPSTIPIARREAAWRLAWLGLLCGTLYRLSNQLSAGRSDAHGGVLAWDHAIPFVAWTVWPYLSIVLPFAAAFLLCRQRAALEGRAQTLLLAQLPCLGQHPIVQSVRGRQPAFRQALLGHAQRSGRQRRRK